MRDDERRRQQTMRDDRRQETKNDGKRQTTGNDGRRTTRDNSRRETTNDERRQTTGNDRRQQTTRDDRRQRTTDDRRQQTIGDNRRQEITDDCYRIEQDDTRPWATVSAKVRGLLQGKQVEHYANSGQAEEWPVDCSSRTPRARLPLQHNLLKHTRTMAMKLPTIDIKHTVIWLHPIFIAHLALRLLSIWEISPNLETCGISWKLARTYTSFLNDEIKANETVSSYIPCLTGYQTGLMDIGRAIFEEDIVTHPLNFVSTKYHNIRRHIWDRRFADQTLNYDCLSVTLRVPWIPLSPTQLHWPLEHYNIKRTVAKLRIVKTINNNIHKVMTNNQNLILRRSNVMIFLCKDHYQSD